MYLSYNCQQEEEISVCILAFGLKIHTYCLLQADCQLQEKKQVKELWLFLSGLAGHCCQFPSQATEFFQCISFFIGFQTLPFSSFTPAIFCAILSIVISVLKRRFHFFIFKKCFQSKVFKLNTYANVNPDIEICLVKHLYQG